MSLANTLIEPLVSDAEELAAIGFATPEDIDTAMHLGAGHPQGPLRTSPRYADVAALATVPGSVAIIGTGTMAAGIVEVFAKAGTKTAVIGRTAERAASVLERIDRRLERSVELGKLEASARSRVVANITAATSLDSAAGVDLVIEAVAEELEIKRTVFADLERATSEIPLASNTSSFRVAEISAGLTHPERVFALHFFNPAPAMRLVEVAAGEQTRTEIVSRSSEWARGIGKVPVSCSDDTGFILNRLLIPYLNDAARTCASLQVSWPVADAAVRDELGHPMGPFELMDLIGLDVMVLTMQTMHRRFVSDRYAPAPALIEQVAAGRIGRKSGAGFHDYEAKA